MGISTLLQRFMRSEEGATAIEYSIVAAILGIAVVGAVGTIRDELNDTFISVSTELDANNDVTP